MKSPNEITEFQELFSEVLTEGFGEPTGQSGISSYTSPVKGKTYSPGEDASPYKNLTGIEDVVSGGAGSDELANSKAPKVRPYPLDTIIDFLADAYVQMTNVEGQLLVAGRNHPNLSKGKIELLKDLMSQSTEIKKAIYGISTAIDRLILDT